MRFKVEAAEPRTLSPLLAPGSTGCGADAAATCMPSVVDEAADEAEVIAISSGIRKLKGCGMGCFLPRLPMGSKCQRPLNLEEDANGRAQRQGLTIGLPEQLSYG